MYIYSLFKYLRSRLMQYLNFHVLVELTSYVLYSNLFYILLFTLLRIIHYSFFLIIYFCVLVNNVVMLFIISLLVFLVLFQLRRDHLSESQSLNPAPMFLPKSIKIVCHVVQKMFFLLIFQNFLWWDVIPPWYQIRLIMF